MPPPCLEDVTVWNAINLVLVATRKLHVSLVMQVYLSGTIQSLVTGTTMLSDIDSSTLFGREVDFTAMLCTADHFLSLVRDLSPVPPCPNF